MAKKESSKKPETVEQHIRRMAVFTPGETEALIKAGVSHDKVDQLAANKAQAPEPEPETAPEPPADKKLTTRDAGKAEEETGKQEPDAGQ